MKIPELIMEKLPKDNVKLAEMFYWAEMPLAREFSGQFYVKMLTGAFPDLSFLDHRKFITEVGSGFNDCSLIGDWGEFLTSPREMEDGDPAMMLDYNLETNSRFTRRIRDYVRKLEDGLFLGRFHYRLKGEDRFVGFFALIAPELIMSEQETGKTEREGHLASA